MIQGSLGFANVNGAVMSSEGRYRYLLWRSWGCGPRILWVMLNPSTADAEADDPTIRRCMGFSRSWNYAGLTVVNLFALRATDPRELAKADDPIGPFNDIAIRTAIDTAAEVVMAWGGHPMARRGRGQWAAELVLARGGVPMCLGTTKTGAPAHPLYLAADTRRVPWAWA